MTPIQFILDFIDPSWLRDLGGNELSSKFFSSTLITEDRV